jgi:hypothetical protein
MTRITTIALTIIALMSIGVRVDVSESEPGDPSPHAPMTQRTIRETSPSGIPAVEPVATEPGVTGATPEQAIVITWALDRYAQAGLELPPLVIEVHDSSDGCQGNRGIYVRDGLGDVIHLCDTSTPVVLHELAHAWTEHHTSDEVRNAFLEHEGLTDWAGADVPYGERGTERASQTMSLCLAERPLSADDALRYGAYLDGYEILTGRPSPRLAPPVAPPATDEGIHAVA